MPLELLTPAQLLAPIAIVAGVLLLPNAVLPMDRPWVRHALVLFVLLVILRYMLWRVTATLDTTELGLGEAAWVYFVFGVEVMALFDAGILYLTFLRTTDRTEEADRHELNFHLKGEATAPSVDVFIATYNEPLAVIEKSMIGALSLDYPNFRVWVLDDGRRRWLHDYCQRKGIGYITRPDNTGAKAGNINHALQVTDGDFVMVLDADFVAQRGFLARAMGFFDDPRVGIVQIPHCFYNHDPMQANLAVRKVLPDDQRFFFEAIMPSRDGWDAAFCCGSNSVTRRSAIDETGGGLPTDSITEDMLLTLLMLRKGYVTRYLGERLAYGLAPESVSAFFVQRQRWARGAMQILYLRSGPLGPGLRLVHRLLFMPTHWLSQSLMLITSLLAPMLFMLFGLQPLTNVTIEGVIFYLVPMIMVSVGGIVAFAPNKYFPIASQVLGIFQSFKLLPTVLQTIVRPYGHVFKVTPKGSQAGGPGYERGTFIVANVLMAGTFLGMVLSAAPETRVVAESGMVALLAFWGTLNCLLLMLVAMLCLQAPVRRGEERFAVDETVTLEARGGTLHQLRAFDLSPAGIGLFAPQQAQLARGEAVSVRLNRVGRVEGRVVRVWDDRLGVAFDLPESIERDLLIRKIFTSGLDTTTVTVSSLEVVLSLLARIFSLSSDVGRGAETGEMPQAPEPPEERLPRRTYLLQPLHTHRALEIAAIGQDELAA